LPCDPSVLSNINGTLVALVLLATVNVNDPWNPNFPLA